MDQPDPPPDARARLRAFVLEGLRAAGDRGELDDAGSLFMSGRLDSLSMTRLVIVLEDEFGLDFGLIDFDAEQLDTIEALLALLGTAGAGRR